MSYTVIDLREESQQFYFEDLLKTTPGLLIRSDHVSLMVRRGWKTIKWTTCTFTDSGQTIYTEDKRVCLPLEWVRSDLSTAFEHGELVKVYALDSKIKTFCIICEMIIRRLFGEK